MIIRMKTGLGLLMLAWVLVAVVCCFRGRFDVVVAMLASYALGGAASAHFKDDDGEAGTERGGPAT